VEGSLDDPDFRFGRVVLHLLASVLEKAVTAPFSALASLVGGDDADLSVADLPPGGAQLDDAARGRIDHLAKALQERPGLGLEIEGTVDDAADRGALQQQALAERLAHARKAAGGAEAVSAAERPRLVAALYAQAFPAAATPAVAKGADPSPDALREMEARLAAQIEIAPEALRALAAERAAQARAAVLAAGIDPGRLFLVEGGDRARKEGGARVYFTLR
jgi:hypothetical protein